MSLTVMRRIKFNAGHRLLGHEGKCRYFHGHNYVAEFYVTAREPDELGRVIDFARLKELLKGWIDEHWDHGFILSAEDANGIAALQQVEPPRLFLLHDNPTAENMASYLLHVVCPQLLDELNVTAWKVVVWESDETCAEVTLDEYAGTGENEVAGAQASRW